ncbi:hypothetical protein O181_055562 [Austropuccinia psidii MF-1]|uniref:Uncharacterized protein n=1 Tax=Austropuccinia psidii MF-1 TaxID=1389203 RepID=A0A9Q3HTK9_9BASI|nr:hypothetical protein [Austropuccinia psidii MF-1]
MKFKPTPTHKKLVYISTKNLAKGMVKYNLSLQEFLRSMSRRYDKACTEFQNHDKYNILDRASYVIQASFIQIQQYKSMRLPPKLRKDAVENFDEKVFQLVKYFWELVLFDVGEPPSLWPKITESIQASEEFPKARRALQNCKGGDETARNASWHASTFLVKWLWDHQLDVREKGAINSIIKSLGQQASAK